MSLASDGACGPHNAAMYLIFLPLTAVQEIRFSTSSFLDGHLRIANPTLIAPRIQGLGEVGERHLHKQRLFCSYSVSFLLDCHYASHGHASLHLAFCSATLLLWTMAGVMWIQTAKCQSPKTLCGARAVQPKTRQR